MVLSWLRTVFADDNTFDRYITLLAFWPITAGILDSRAHGAGSFAGGAHRVFAPEHVFLYSGLAAVTAVLAYRLYLGWREERSILAAIPTGYAPGLLGILLMVLIGGPFDLYWHSLFGFEQGGLENGSVGHMLLMMGGLLLAATPLRRAWHTGVKSTWASQFAMLTSTGFLLTILTWTVYPMHPFVEPYAWSVHPLSQEVVAPLAAGAGMVFHTGFLVGIFLHLHNKFDIVRGGFTYIVLLNGLLFAILRGYFIFIPLVLITGIVADILRERRPPSWDRPWNLRLYAWLIPSLFAALYVLTILPTGGTRLTIHELTAFSVMSGIGGLVLSYAIYPSGRQPAS